MNDITQTLLRSVLKVGGGMLAAKGIIDTDAPAKFIGAFLIIAAVAWGIWHRTPKDRILIPGQLKPAPEKPVGSTPLTMLSFLLVIGILVMSVLSGCTYDAAHRKAAQRQLEPGLQRMVTGTVDSLHALPTTNRTEHTVVATRLAEQAQLIAGTPEARLDVAPLIRAEEQRQSAQAAGTNVTLDPIASSAERSLVKEMADQSRLIVKERRATQSLIDRGEVAEAQRNARIKRWTAWLSFGGLGLGGMIALIVFVPVSIPIIGRILAALVTKIPKLAGLIGVVSTGAFDRTVKGIEDAKAKLPQEHQDTLFGSLSRSMDQAHKALVKVRKPIVAETATSPTATGGSSATA